MATGNEEYERNGRSTEHKIIQTESGTETNLVE